LAGFEEGKKAVRLNCGHLFHQECLRPWLGMRDACPYCNTPGARSAMKNVQVSLINDPERLNELNIYVAHGAMPLLCMWNATLLLTEDGREILIRVAIRRSMLRCVLNRFPNAGRCLTFVLVVLVYIAAGILARHVNKILQLVLEFAFNAVGMMSIFSGAESLGKTIEPLLLVLLMIAFLLASCIGIRARTVVPPPLTGEFKAENMCVIPAEHAEKPMMEDPTEAPAEHTETPMTEDRIEAEITQSQDMEVSTSTGSTMDVELADPNSSECLVADFANEGDAEPMQLVKRRKGPASS